LKCAKAIEFPAWQIDKQGKLDIAYRRWAISQMPGAIRVNLYLSDTLEKIVEISRYFALIGLFIRANHIA
jgi:hypothetical protein